MTVILDYDMGNVCSIQNMLKKIGERAVISRDPAVLAEADRMILPGVGSFDAGMEQLEHFGLPEEIRHYAVLRGKPLLGICLGMQLLGERSEEGKPRPGLGLIPFEIVRFRLTPEQEKEGLRVPHMGWDYAEPVAPDPLTDGLPSGQRYYFVHSYRAVCPNPDHVLMTCDYGGPVTVGVRCGSVYGVQFHPEKSHRFGMELLRRFTMLSGNKE